jgi:hypothetical protein
MTDVPDGSGPIPRRSPRVSDGGAPVSGALAMVLAAVAVIAGFFILRSISGNGEQTADFPDSGISASNGDSPGSDATVDPSATTEPVATLAPTTTLPSVVTQGATVLVANANSIGGSATAMTRALETGPGFTMAAPVNASAAVGDSETSVIYFDAANPAAEAVAQSLSRVLGGVASVAPVANPAPTADGTLGDATVLLMLGNDKAGKTLAELAPDLQQQTTQITSPPVAGSTETTAPPG